MKSSRGSRPFTKVQWTQGAPEIAVQFQTEWNAIRIKRNKDLVNMRKIGGEANQLRVSRFHVGPLKDKNYYNFRHHPYKNMRVLCVAGIRIDAR